MIHAFVLITAHREATHSLGMRPAGVEGKAVLSIGA